MFSAGVCLGQWCLLLLLFVATVSGGWTGGDFFFVSHISLQVSVYALLYLKDGGSLLGQNLWVPFSFRLISHYSLFCLSSVLCPLIRKGTSCLGNMSILGRVGGS